MATLDLFFPKDTVLAYRQYSDGTKIPVLSQSPAVQLEPVVILINQGTKGPAELVAHIARKWYGDIGRRTKCRRSDRLSCLVSKSSTCIAHGRYTFVVVQKKTVAWCRSGTKSIDFIESNIQRRRSSTAGCHSIDIFKALKKQIHSTKWSI